jgi:hypothetical protein
VRERRIAHRYRQIAVGQDVPEDVLWEAIEEAIDAPRAEVVRVREVGGRMVEVLGEVVRGP